MNRKTSGVSRGQRSKNFHGEGPNWILIAGGALLSTLSIRLGFKLKQALDSKQQANATSSLKGLFAFMASICYYSSLACSSISKFSSLLFREGDF